MYSSTSPWKVTPFEQANHLGLYQKRSIPAQDTDILYEIKPQYTYRPDLLAFDLYQTPDLWWVFAQRNLDTIRDPIYDFEAGIEIYLPQSELLRETLGVN